MKRSPKPGDMNQRMHAVVQEAAGLSEAPQKDPKAAARGRLGGRARAESMSPVERVKAAKRARAVRTERAHEAVELQDEHPSA